jgi:hypothetical protein
MRNALGAVVLALLVALLWKIWPREAIAAYELERGSGTARTPEPAAAPRVPASNALRVLFVGNSHTYMHDMPRMIAGLANADRWSRPFDFAMDAPGGSTLVQHVASNEAARLLRQGHWDYMVLQDQQQASSFSQFPQQLERDFLGSIRTLDIIGRAAGAKTVLYMTAARLDGDPDNMPHDTYDAMQDRISQNYKRAADEMGAALAPVGLAAQWVHRVQPDFGLWENDRYHPSLAGSYLAACVLYQTLYRRAAYGNAYLAGLAEPDARLMQRAANGLLQWQDF